MLELFVELQLHRCKLGRLRLLIPNRVLPSHSRTRLMLIKVRKDRGFSQRHLKHIPLLSVGGESSV